MSNLGKTKPTFRAVVLFDRTFMNSFYLIKPICFLKQMIRMITMILMA